MALRQFRELRPAIQNNQEQRTSVQTGVDVLADYAYSIALNQLVPRIAEISKKAVTVNPKYYYYFIRKQFGRVCSCTFGAQSAEGQCPICWKTGIVGGYDKYGTVTEVVDMTYPNVVLCNMEPNFGDQTRPVMFKLTDGTTRGYLIAKVELRSNRGSADYITTMYRKIQGTSTVAYIRAPSDSDYVQLTTTTLNARLSSHYLYVKIFATRPDTSYDPNLFSHLVLRYKTIDDTRIIGDAPRRLESRALAEFGLYENFTSQAIFFDNTISHFSTDDWLYRVDDSTRWKIIEVSPNKPLGINTSTFLTARKSQIFDTYQLIPVGGQ